MLFKLQLIFALCQFTQSHYVSSPKLESICNHKSISTAFITVIVLQ